MKVLSIIENTEGSATMSYELEQDEENILFRFGLETVLDNKEIKVLAPTDFVSDKKVKTVELEEEEYFTFINIGIIQAIKEKIKMEK